MLSPICLAVCPSINLSVTRVDQSKTVEITIMEFLRYKFNPEIPTGSPWVGASNKGGVGKKAIF